MLLFLLDGLLLLRFADRQLFALLFQLPPRITRFEPDGCHPKSLQYVPPKPSALRRHHEGQQRRCPLLQLGLTPPPLDASPLIPPELPGKSNLAPPRRHPPFF
jgi:hypothetical protein